MVEDVLSPQLGHERSQLADRLPVGSPEHCAELLNAYAAVGARRILLWPVRDPIRQLEVFAEKVRPHIAQRIPAE